MNVEELLTQNKQRLGECAATFNPVTGEGSVGTRLPLFISDYDLPRQWVPAEMLAEPLIQKIVEAGTVSDFVHNEFEPEEEDEAVMLHEQTCDLITRIRYKHDFPFWCATLIYIKPKETTKQAEVLFTLNRPQRRLAAFFEEQRLAGQPLRTIILKARQWGGSTLTQVYMAWLQLLHYEGMNSLIVAHVQTTAYTIMNMFQRLLKRYPAELLHPLGWEGDQKEARMSSLYGSRTTYQIPQRSCTIKVASIVNPDACRGDALSAAHLTEVGIWKETPERTTEDIVTSALSGILLSPGTMITFESTAKRVGDFFHREWSAAQAGNSQFKPFFVPWHEIEQYRLKLQDTKAFATTLLRNRNSTSAASDREDSGAYLWWLWEQGAPLEAIAWYQSERRKYASHQAMASEFPTTPEEAFAHRGTAVFSASAIDRLRPHVRPADFRGELTGDSKAGPLALRNLHYTEDEWGGLHVWEKPEPDNPDAVVTNRYLCVADVGRGLSEKADFSVIVVFDRLPMMDVATDGSRGKPTVVAQWRGRIDMDLLAWRAAQVAAWYNNALLVVESNTLESRGGIAAQYMDATAYVLEELADAYPNIYMREQSAEDIKQGVPRKYGFHTNARTKQDVVDELKRQVREELYIERDALTLDEFACYEQRSNGSYGAIAGKHDDLLMTRAIGLYISTHQQPMPAITKKATWKNLVTRSRGLCDI